MNKFMKQAVKEAFKGMEKEEGGPFGAVIVKDGKIIARAHNQVLKNNDPTCHAEMQAIRKACKKLKRFDLSDCEIYTSCEPCPMCYGGICWSKIKKMYYGCDAQDANSIGFDDEYIYEAIRGNINPEEVVAVEHIDREECLKPFDEWKSKTKKTQY